MSSRGVDDRGVVVTGLGMVTPLGGDRESTWSSVLSGQLAGQQLDPTQLGPAWQGIAPSSEWRGCPVTRDWTRITEPLIDDAVTAAREAMLHAGLVDLVGERTGCVIGASKGGLHRYVPAYTRDLAHSSAADDLPPEQWPWSWPNAAAARVAQTYNICGPVLAPGAACATGLVSLIRACDLIRQGICDVVLSGSSDASLQPALLASYRRLGVMARQGEPATAGRPFDVRRQGFLVGEGAAVLVLESRAHAEQRGARPLAEITGGRVLSDGAGVTGLEESADGLTRAIDESLCESRTAPAQIDLVSFHGTGTEQNDRSEATAWSRVIAGQKSRAHGCAFKGGLGHLMGGAGSVEAALSILALRDQVAPPTANLIQIDPSLGRLLDLTMTGPTPVARPIDNVLKLSLGFGGPVAALVLRRPR